jgi:hypothetical protein
MKKTLSVDDLPECLRVERAALPIEAQELLDWPQELAAAAGGHADGHHDVIYTYAAHKLIQECTLDEEQEAEDCVREMGDLPTSYNDWAVALAYQVIFFRYLRTVQNPLICYRESVADWLLAAESEGDEEPSAELSAALDEADALEIILD